MTESLITQCPTCGTSFKLSSSQLKAAAGAVRCGACLEVFAANEHILRAYPETVAAGEEPQAAADTEHSSLTSRYDIEYPEQASKSDLERTASEINAVSADSNAYTELDPDESSLPDWQPGTNIVYHLADSSDFTEAASESLDEAIQEGFSSEDDFESAIEPLDEQTRASLNESLDSNPIDIIEIQQPAKSFTKIIFYSLAIVLLSLMLAIQFLWFNRATLAAREDLRAYYLQACSLTEQFISCKLPNYTNLQQISTRRLIVRTHPSLENVLIVDAIIVNSGVFAQPFPKLELKFSDLELNTLASRRFTPSEYLSGEMSGMEFMPAGTEVRLALEIVDPGDDAISYELYAVSTSSQ
jgi:predicted Zn finger-like uncharacterized protein